MNRQPVKSPRILAVAPASRGFGFIVVENAVMPIDWGTKDARVDKNARCLCKVEDLLEFYQPDVLVVEDGAGNGSRRCDRIQLLIADILRLGLRRDIATHRYSRAEIRECFAAHDATTKFEISRAVAAQWPELNPWLPPFRKPWMSEDIRMSIFDAAALARTYLNANSSDNR